MKQQQQWQWEGPREFDHKGSRDHPAYHWHRVYMADGSTVAYTPDASTAAVLCDSERIRTERNALRTDLKRAIEALRLAVKCARMWHDSADHSTAYRFDLSDHPDMRIPVALLNEMENL